MNKLLCIILLSPLFCKSQDHDSLKTELKMILLNSMDSSFIAFVFTSADDLNSDTSFLLTKCISLDSLKSHEYKYEYQTPFEAPITSIENFYDLPGIKYLSCEDLVAFLQYAKMKFIIPEYGYMTHRKSEKELEIDEKYGLAIWNLGCVYQSSTEGYLRSAYRLLDLKNGLGWYERYKEELESINVKK